MEFFCPVKIISGIGSLDLLKGYQARRVLIVTDRFFSQNGKAMEIGQRIPGAQVEIFDEVEPNPTAELAARGAALCDRFRPDILIALGGGSPMDCAKGIRLASSCSMMFLAIPTTAGSGSEVTSFSILTHGGVKQVVVDPLLRPDVAVLDPSLMEALPKSLLADTGMDLLAHGLEAAAAKGHSGFTDALAAYAVSTALEHLLPAWQGEQAMRGRLQEAATMAGMSFDNAGLGLCHAMAHVLGGAFHLPHGRLCAILLPAVMDVNAPAATAQYAGLAKACGIEGATRRLQVRNLQKAIIRLRAEMKMPSTLQQAGIEPEQVQRQQSELVEAMLADSCCQSNPVPVTAQLAEQVLKAVMR